MSPAVYVCTVTYGDVRQRFFAARDGLHVLTDVYDGAWWHEHQAACVPDESALVTELLRTKAYPMTVRALLQGWQRVRQLGSSVPVELVAEVIEPEPLHVVLQGEPS